MVKTLMGADWTGAAPWGCIRRTPTADGGVGAYLSDATSLFSESGLSFFERWVSR
jgi:hypothetical protein